MRTRVVWVVSLLVLATVARADEVEDVDTEVAKRHFTVGIERYAANDYAAALHEFEAARRFRSRPALDFNIGRCLDRLERLPAAIVAYRRYLAAEPTAPDAPTVSERVRILEARVAAEAPPPVVAPPAPPPVLVVTPPPAVAAALTTPPPVVAARPPLHRRGWFWGVLGGAVVVVGGAAVITGVAVSQSGGSSMPPPSDGGDHPVMF